jgi:DNA-binding GntR family transcriptional regulator
MSTVPQEFGDVARQTAAKERFQRIHRTLRNRICLLEYEPGSYLGEEGLAREFGTSRTPVRRVLQRLEFEGLTYSQQGRGTIVTTIDVKSLHEIYTIRVRLAEMIGELAVAQVPAGTIENLRDLVQRSADVPDELDMRTFGEINIGLHEQFQSIIGNGALRQLSDMLFYQTARIWFQILPALGWQQEFEHLRREINETIVALEVSDFTAAGVIHRNNISMVQVRIGQYLKSLPDAQDSGSVRAEV